MTLKEIVDIVKIIKELKNLNWNNPADVDKLKVIGEKINSSSLAKSFLKIKEAFSSGGFISGMKAIGASSTSLIAAHPARTILGVTLASMAAANKWVYDADDKLNAASEAIGNYQNTISELDSVNSELEETKIRIDELNAKESLSLIEQDELDKLERSNTELERRQIILDNLKVSQLETAKNSMTDYLNNKTSKDYSYNLFNPTTWKGYKNQMIVSSNEALNYEYQDIEATPLAGIESHLNAIKELQSDIAELEQEQARLSDEKDIQELQKKIDKKESLMEDYKTFVSDNLSKISDATETFDSSYFDVDKYNQIQDILNQWDEILGTSGSRIESKLNGIFEIQDLKDSGTQQALVDYVSNLKDLSEFDLYSENLDNIEGIERLRISSKLKQL